MKKQNRIEWLDGLRGIACILIFVHHFLLMFYPAIHFGESVPSQCRGFDIYLSQSPLSVIVNGNFLVALFCVISGVVISLQVMSMQDNNKLADVIVKRYLRLMFPVIPLGFLVYFMLRADLFYNFKVADFTQSPWATWYYGRPISFVQTIRSIFISTWFWGDDCLSTAFWMLSDLFYGTFWSIALSIVSWKYPKKAWGIYAFLAVALYDHGSIRFAFVLGTLLAWLYIYCQQCFRKSWGFVALFVGLYLGGYPTAVIPTSSYRYLSTFNGIDMHTIGAFLVLYGIWSLPKLQKFLSTSICKKLGEISYSVYLLHIPLIFSVSTWMFLLVRDNMSYLNSVMFTFTISLFLLIAAADGYYRLVEKKTVCIQQKILNKFGE